jgi:hypothetical protein
MRSIQAISGKESTRLACLFAQRLRCRLSYIALLCAFSSALLLTPNIRRHTEKLFLESA